MSKAPDTRGKLDSQRGLNPKKKVVKKAIDIETLKKNINREKKEVVKQQSPLKITVVEKKESKGSIFKKQHGYSKSMKRAMKKHGLDPQAFSDSLNAYRAIRKKRKITERKARQEKHAKSAAYKRANGKSKTGKGKTPVAKKAA